MDSAVGYEAPPAGLYRCNMTKLAGKYLDLIAYDYFQCRVIVEDGRRQFVKLTGSQRQVGYIYDAAPDHAGDDRHGVFLGTLVLGDEDRLVPYGSREDRDEAGIVQKLAEKRWRMIFPKPFYEADINIIDLEQLAIDTPRVIYDLPAGGRRVFQGASGYRYTIVSGEVIMADGVPTGALPGRLIRAGQQASPAKADNLKTNHPSEETV